MKSKKAKVILWASVSIAAVVAGAIMAGIHYFHRYLPAELMPDIRAAIAARNVRDPDARLNKYLEGRYGSMDNPANRERAFEDFFNSNHIKAMQIIVKHSPSGQQETNVRAMAHWIANYRQNMSSQEKSDLGDFFHSDGGRAALQASTTQYLSQDIRYRSATAPVIAELMATLTAVRK